MRRYISLIVIALLLLSCNKEKREQSKPKEVDRTVIVYMAADNNLGSNGYARNDMSEMIEGFPTETGNKLVLYCDIAGKSPKIVEIKYNSDLEQNEAVTIEEFVDEDSASPEVMKRRINQIKELYPAPSYGLVLWSHGFGWYPKEITYPIYTSSFENYKMATSWNEMAESEAAPMTKSFGEDGASKLDIKDIVDALEDTKFEFIIFDACYMACAEVAYDLRNSCQNLIVSSAEVLAEGFPYHLTSPIMLSKSVDYDALCKAFYDYYNSYSGMNRSATIAHIKTEGMERLQSVTTEIVANNQDKIASIDISSLQQMDRRSHSSGHIFIDAGSYIKAIASSSELSEFNSALGATVSSVYNTPHYFCSDNGSPSYGGFTIKENCGLTLYLPQDEFEDATIAYQEIPWSNN